ncbi:hypothetical protein BDK51DRAFT_39586 [Blyttiomyces helicus]|uniref:Ankyrin repeat-containing domain protein n=1 Tax=Blyttiomyces helicus TaxID=388810 RepID=A0A4P9VX21_9FUNG|nr:hypothetical protein BDK51DRAFT_39586 [Blyttiomyces helicus]|eukprot:RKO83243.1 hypothetical protein BDK51DRAFT_39586 [Blyttiomyces helicus]
MFSFLFAARRRRHRRDRPWSSPCDPTTPYLCNELIDQILELCPVDVAVALRRKAVLRTYILNGKLRRPIQRALKRLDVEALKFFAGGALAVVIGDPMVCACTQKWREMVACLIEIGPDGVGDDAAKQGDLSFVKFLQNIAPLHVFTTSAMDWAAQQMFARTFLTAITSKTRSEHTKTVTSVTYKIVRFLHESRTEGCTRKAMDRAARVGRLDIVRFLHQHRSEGFTVDAMDDAAGAGRLHVVRFFMNTVQRAARDGQWMARCAPGDLISSGFFMSTVLRAARNRQWKMRRAPGGLISSVSFISTVPTDVPPSRWSSPSGNGQSISPEPLTPRGQADAT